MGNQITHFLETPGQKRGEFWQRAKICLWWKAFLLVQCSVSWQRGAICQLRQNPLVHTHLRTLALRCSLFLYRMDIGVGRCVSQASQHHGRSAKLFCFIAPPFPLFSATQTYTLQHFSNRQIYWFLKITIISPMILRWNWKPFSTLSCYIISSFLCCYGLLGRQDVPPIPGWERGKWIKFG